MGNEDRYAEKWEVERSRSRPTLQETKRSYWALCLALGGFFLPFGFYQYLSLVPFRYDMAWWEGGGAIVFLLFSIVIFVFEAVATALALRAKRALAAKFALGFVVLILVFVGWIVLDIIRGLMGYMPLGYTP